MLAAQLAIYFERVENRWYGFKEQNSEYLYLYIFMVEYTKYGHNQENTILMCIQNMQRDTGVSKLYFLRYFAEGCTFMYQKVGSNVNKYQ
jgi:hypothetical protein